ncbi:MAG: HD domain-containing protein [Clostridia bacterium]|nr:HD domain-containing protein [Clostridia bacterium]
MQVTEKRLTREELVALAKERLPEKRFLHTLSVEKEALYIASHLSPDLANDVSRASLLHDITKPWSYEEHIDFAKKTGRVLSENDLKSPETLHAMTGGIMARLMGESVWQAIECHTTGKPNMSPLEMIVFLADYTEETRTHRACMRERELLHEALEKANGYEEKLEAVRRSVCRVLDGTVSHLKEKNVFIHPLTLDALESYRTLIAKE